MPWQINYRYPRTRLRSIVHTARHSDQAVTHSDSQLFSISYSMLSVISKIYFWVLQDPRGQRRRKSQHVCKDYSKSIYSFLLVLLCVFVCISLSIYVFFCSRFSVPYLYRISLHFTDSNWCHIVMTFVLFNCSCRYSTSRDGCSFTVGAPFSVCSVS